MSFKEKIDLDRLPVHVAIIMDGNGRWPKNVVMIVHTDISTEWFQFENAPKQLPK